MFFLVLLSDVCMPVLLGSKSLIDLLVINICEHTRGIFMLLLLRALKIIQTLLIFSLLCKGGSCEDAPSVMILVWNPWLDGSPMEPALAAVSKASSSPSPPAAAAFGTP